MFHLFTRPKKLFEHLSETNLNQFLAHREELPSQEVKAVKEHLDNCLPCWKAWNQVRWNAARHTTGMKELKEYLGDEFVDYFDSSWALAEEWEKVHPKNIKEVAEFYKHTPHYLYNLTIWEESGDRYEFDKIWETLRERFHVHSVIDYGCGVGNDTIPLLEKGFQVMPIDFECPSVEFLRWRLKKRGFKVGVLDTEKVKAFPDADMFWAIDVLEHMPDPLSVVRLLSPKTRVFAHISQFNNKSGGRHPFHFEFNEFLLNASLKRKGFRHVPMENISLWVRDL